MNESQELHCHNCNRYVQFPLDLSMDGQYVLNCPNCNHQHYRVVNKGVISEVRWGTDPSQMQSTPPGWITILNATSTTASVDTSSSSASQILNQSWLNSSTSVTSGW